MKNSIYKLFIFTFVTVIAYFAYKKISTTNKPALKVRVVNFFDGKDSEIPFILEALNKKYEVEYVNKNYDVLINGFLNDSIVKPEAKADAKIENNAVKIYYTSEVYIGNPKKFVDTYDLVMGFDFIDRPNYIRVPFYYARHKERISSDYMPLKGKCDPKSKKYFACFLNTNSGLTLDSFDGARLRNRLFHLLSLYKFVASGGKHMNNLNEVIPHGDTEKWLSNCKFTIAYENTIYPGYITEKPHQAWFSGSIPLYDADKSVLVDINKKAIIYAGDFANENDLVDYIKKVDNDDELYCKIWNEKLIDDPSKNYDVLKEKVATRIYELVDRKLAAKTK